MCKYAHLPSRDTMANGIFKSIEELKNYPYLNCNILPVCGGGCPKSWKEGFIPCPAFKNNIGEYLLLSYIYEKNNKNFIGEKN